MSIALQIEDVSKMYRLGTVGTGTLSHDLNRLWARMRGKADPTLKIGMENNRTEIGGDYVWALKDINLKVKQGEILGIIGRNGAGKSTLLKLLSRVTAPTTGTIKANGRIASLLEVGTGFHPELTGRENVFLNGAIMGMTRPEIARRLDEIVEFSGCAKYIDTPVKRYSSGMTVRLGFAVAAHLESEILIVDEVLAVGDFEFQKKCIEKMQDISRQSQKTILFVSHNLSSIRNMCQSGVLLRNGELAFQGGIEDVLVHYGKNLQTDDVTVVDAGKLGFQFTKFWVEDHDGIFMGRRVRSGQPCRLCIEYECSPESVTNFSIRIGVLDSFGTRITQLSSDDFGIVYATKKVGNITVEFERFPFASGQIQINLNAYLNRTTWHHIANASLINVENGDFFGTQIATKGLQIGPVLVDQRWQSSSPQFC